MLIQPILDIAEICARKNLQKIVLSPGSRVAHLAIAFARHPEIETLTITDERSAAFVAMGMANQLLSEAIKQKELTQSPDNQAIKLPFVGIACTSGSAVYNYAPAVAEAFYQQIPLLILTADRPPEWIDQLDGQTIRQTEIFGKHVKAAFNLPADYAHPDSVWQTERIVNEAINLMQTLPYGPVHINVPIREPFYPTPEEKVKFSPKVRIIQPIFSHQILSKAVWQNLLSIWESTENKLIIAGQDYYKPALIKTLQNLYQDFRVPIIGDIISNIQNLSDCIRFHDTSLMAQDDFLKRELQPELLITFGKSLISKNLKIFLRKYKPKWHWHIQSAGLPADTFQTLTHHLQVEPEYFFKTLYEDLDFQTMLERDEEGEETEYNQLWQKLNQKAKKILLNQSRNQLIFNELNIFNEILSLIPENSILHLANSMAVRYANFWGLSEYNRGIEVFANRGTSGIDGSNSTAVGAAVIAKDKTITLISGDLAFFYDRNGLWHNYLPKNLRIILINNQSGNIFRMIEGPSQQPELEEYFETFHHLEAAHTAQDFGLIYEKATNYSELNTALSHFFEASEKAKILEIKTDKKLNAQVFNEFKQMVKESI
jgi:2-succinyl-5-enolpyruvyl-6-hydroxy-3-cyclohexene-1-carboxylate synthase